VKKSSMCRTVTGGGGGGGGNVTSAVGTPTDQQCRCCCDAAAAVYCDRGEWALLCVTWRWCQGRPALVWLCSRTGSTGVCESTAVRCLAGTCLTPPAWGLLIDQQQMGCSASLAGWLVCGGGGRWLVTLVMPGHVSLFGLLLDSMPAADHGHWKIIALVLLLLLLHAALAAGVVPPAFPPTLLLLPSPSSWRTFKASGLPSTPMGQAAAAVEPVRLIRTCRQPGSCCKPLCRKLCGSCSTCPASSGWVWGLWVCCCWHGCCWGLWCCSWQWLWRSSRWLRNCSCWLRCSRQSSGYSAAAGSGYGDVAASGYGQQQQQYAAPAAAGYGAAAPGGYGAAAGGYQQQAGYGYRGSSNSNRHSRCTSQSGLLPPHR